MELINSLKNVLRFRSVQRMAWIPLINALNAKEIMPLIPFMIIVLTTVI